MNFNLEGFATTAILVAVLGFFIKMWINGIKVSIDKIESELKNKVDLITCERAHRLVDRHAHTHGTFGASGEVIDQQGRQGQQ